MPHRDLRGEEIPAGKISRRVEYNAILGGSPEWMQLFGEDATEEATSIAAGRGELELTVDKSVGGYRFPAFDPTAFREIRVGVAFHDGLSEPNTVSIGFVDQHGTEPNNAMLLQQASSRSELSPAKIVRIEETEREEHDEIGSFVGALERADADPDVCAWVEVRIRPFQRGEIVMFGGAGRGDIAHEATGQHYGISTPMYPILSIDTRHAGTLDTVGIGKAWFELIHN